MADDDANEEEEEEGGGGKKKIIMGVVAVAALGGVYNFVLKAPPPEEGAEGMPEEIPAEVEPIEGEIVELEEMILNIGAEGESGYLRVGLAIILEEGILAADFEMESAIAKDVAVQYLSSVPTDQLRSADGRQKAKEELSVLMREAYDDSKVVRVLFTALVMQ